MKQLIALIILLSASFFSNAYSINYVGTIDAKRSDNGIKQYFNADIFVYAGSNGQDSNIRLVFDMPKGMRSYDIIFNGVNPSEVTEYQTLIRHLNKASDWAKIAQDNNANTIKDIGSCDISGTSCKISFESSNGGRDIVTKIWISNDFTLNEGTFRLTPKQVNQLLKWLDNASMIERLEASAIENNQSDDLFN